MAKKQTEQKKENPRIEVQTGNTEVLKVRFLSEISYYLSKIAKSLEEKENNG